MSTGPTGEAGIAWPDPGPVWSRVDLRGSAPEVAVRLLGSVLVGRNVALRLVEVEAYTPDDPASHSHRGPTPSNATMFGPAGHLYVYRSHGLHHCGNVTTGGGAAVLLRSGEVVAGRATALSRRQGRGADRPRLLAGGPGRLGQVLALDAGTDDGEDLLGEDLLGEDLLGEDGPLRLHRGVLVPPDTIASGPRVGVRLAAARPWRWWVAGSAAVSPYRRHPRATSLPDDA